MPRTSDSVRQFIALRHGLQQERDALQQRLNDLDAALGAVSSLAQGAAAPVRRGRPPGRPSAGLPAPGPATSRRRGRRPRNAISMRDAIAQVVQSSPMRIRDIVNGMEKLGFRFKSKNPLNSVGAYLYGPEGQKHFKRADGMFSVK